MTKILIAFVLAIGFTALTGYAAHYHEIGLAWFFFIMTMLSTAAGVTWLCDKKRK